MKVAFVQDWLVVSGGAEKVTREILRIWDADIYALVDHLNDTDREFILHGKNARTSFLQKLPGSKRHYRKFLPFFVTGIESFDLREYDLIISSSYAVAKGVKTHKRQCHVCYIHSPIRYAWEQRSAYLKDHNLDSGMPGWALNKSLDGIQKWDVASSHQVDQFIANSENVAAKVKKYYGRDSKVLLPPVDLDLFTLFEGKRDGYLTCGRLVPFKRFDVIMEAFRKMPDQRLTIAGDGPDRRRLENMCPPNVTICGHVMLSELVQKMQRARALIVAADEDLGLTPIEAAACGTPTLAYRKGGYLETVHDGDTGLFFDEQRASAIVDAVRSFESDGVRCDAGQLRESILHLSTDSFRSKLKSLVDLVLKERSELNA